MPKRKIVVWVGVVASFVACSRMMGEEAEWLLRVNGETVSLDTYRQRLRLNQRDVGDIPVLDRQGLQQVKRRLLAELISERLLLQEAARRKIEIPADDLEREIERLSLTSGERTWRSYLLEHYVEERVWQQRVEDRLRIDALIAEEVKALPELSEAELREYYAEVSPQVEYGTEVELSQIVVQDPGIAADIRQRLKAGEPFAELAREHSIGVESGEGGYLGFVRAQDLPESFAPAFALKVGQVSDIVETEFGLHLFKATAVRTSYVPTFDELRASLMELAKRERFESVRRDTIEHLRKSAKIDINQSIWSAEQGE